MASVELSWIPLGAGGHVVRCNGVLYEALAAAVQRRRRQHLFHAALVLTLPDGRHSVEMTPVPAGDPALRGVVATGAVGSRPLGRLRLFRYEVRRWRDGAIPDLGHAVATVTLTTELHETAMLFDALGELPTPVWGRDELGCGEMWTCNSIVAFALERAGMDSDDVPFPPQGRAPGWDAGRRAARRSVRSVGEVPAGLLAGDQLP